MSIRVVPRKDPHAAHFAQGAEGQPSTRAYQAEHSSSFLMLSLETDGMGV